MVVHGYGRDSSELGCSTVGFAYVSSPPSPTLSLEPSRLPGPGITVDVLPLFRTASSRHHFRAAHRVSRFFAYCCFNHLHFGGSSYESVESKVLSSVVLFARILPTEAQNNNHI